MAEQKPMPEWIKNLTVPASTKEFLYQRWLNGDISEKTPPQDWGVITDAAKFAETLPKTFQNVLDFLYKIAPEDATKEKFEKFKTLKELQDNLKVLKTEKTVTDKEIKNLNDWLNTSNASAVLEEINAKEGTNYSLTQFRSLLPKVKETQIIQQKNIEVAEFVFKEAKENNKAALRFLEQDLNNVKKERDLAQFQFQKSLIDETALKAAEQKVINIEADKKKIKDNGELAFAAAGKPGMRATYAFKAQQPTTATSGGFTKTQVEKLLSTSGPGIVATGTKPAAGTIGTGTGGTGTGTGATDATAVTGATGATGTTGVTGATGATGVTGVTGKTTVPGKTKVPGKTGVTTPVDTAWETTFRQTFPAKSWLLDLDRTKYPGLFQLLNTAVSQEWYKSTEGLSRFAASLDATDFYKEISNSKQLKTIQSLVGTLGFEGSDFTKFVSDSINFGYEGDILKQKVYAEVFKKTTDTNQYVNPTALKRVQKSVDYISTQNIAKAYFNRNPADSDIEKVLTGTILSADYERQQREFAKTRYGHLSNLLDQGMTLESIASAYQTTASRLLERNVNDIDMSTGAFEQAVSFGEDGKKRLMTNSEWEKLLRSDPQYGWEKTSNAKDEARSLSANIAQAFGRII